MLFKLEEAMMINSITFIGSDAGGTKLVITPHGVKVVHFPGWEADQLKEISNMLGILQRAAALKTPGLAEKVAGHLVEIVQKQLEGHVNEGGVLVAM
jgi:hypothetical protein